MKVLFINLNLGATAGINNGIAVLSALLKKRAHEVKLLFLCEEMGYGFDLERVRKDIKEFSPGMIGISLVETQFKYMAELCADIRSYYKGFVVCGGPYATMDPEGVLSVEGVDAVCVGEGDDAVVELADAVSTGRDHRKIKNLWSRGRGGRVIRNNLRPFKRLRDLPPEDKGLFNLEALLPIKNYQLEVSFGRGCAYKCAYCINDPYVSKYRRYCVEPVREKDYIRMKDPSVVIDEIKEALGRHPEIRKIAFIDDNFLAQTLFVRDFFKRYKDEVGLPFMCNLNPLSFDKIKGAMLKDAGCDDIRFGLESGSERIKKDIMKRPVSNDRVIAAFAAAKGLGLMTSSFNMIGLPTETKEDVFDTMRLNAAIMPDTVKVMTFYPFKNTPLYEICVRSNLIDHDKKGELDNYDTSTCLKFSSDHRLFLEKAQLAFNWHINSFLDSEAAPIYAKLINDIEAMDEVQWRAFDFGGADRDISEKMRRRNAPHYVKFFNRSMAVKFPGEHLKG